VNFFQISASMSGETRASMPASPQAATRRSNRAEVPPPNSPKIRRAKSPWWRITPGASIEAEIWVTAPNIRSAPSRPASVPVTLTPFWIGARKLSAESIGRTISAAPGTSQSLTQNRLKSRAPMAAGSSTRSGAGRWMSPSGEWTLRPRAFMASL
jgi:hypothetical protein